MGIHIHLSFFMKCYSCDEMSDLYFFVQSLILMYILPTYSDAWVCEPSVYYIITEMVSPGAGGVLGMVDNS